MPSPTSTVSVNLILPVSNAANMDIGCINADSYAWEKFSQGW